MGLEVVDGDEGHVPHERQGLGRADTPTSSAPTSPGPTVAADGVDVRRRVDSPASTSAWATTGVSSSTWARLAISGTTPPKRACRSTWLRPPTTARRGRRPRRPPRSRRTTSRCRGSRRAGAHGCRPARGPRRCAPRRSVVPGTAASMRRGARRSRRVDVVGPHHERVLVGLDVVALADPGRREAEAPVQGLGRLVADARTSSVSVSTPRSIASAARASMSRVPMRAAAATPGRRRWS